MSAWARVENKGDVLRLEIYDVIGADFWTGDNTLKDVSKELKNFDGDQIDVHINSPGGDASQGIAIYNRLQRHSAHVNVYVDGMALSAASVIAMAGDNVEMAENAMMMIHDPWLFAAGNADELRNQAETLDKWAVNIARTYSKKSGISSDDVRDLMKAETWYDADEAAAAGLIDQVTDAPAIAACESAKAYAKQFDKAPKGWTRKLKPVEHKEPEMANDTPTPKDVETVDPVIDVVEESATETPNNSIPKDELAAYLAEFGDQGGRWLSEGKSFDDCRKIQVAGLKAEVKELTDANADLQTKLDAALKHTGEIDALDVGEDADKPKTMAGKIKIARAS